MVNILIDADDKLDQLIEIHKAEERYDSKSQTIIEILKDFFKKKGDRKR